MIRKYINTFSNNYEKVNDEFLKCTVAIMSCDQIANGTKFTKSGVDNASPTLNYVPLIGYFNGEDFEGHGQEMVWTDNGIEFRVKTIPFGVAIKDTQRWERIQKPNGEFEDYFCVDVYMWSRYEEATQRVMDNKCNQSMEIKVTSGEYQSDYYQVDEFAFQALCILGEDVTPAFNLAKVRTSDKFEKDDFKVEYSEMVQALDKYLKFEDGGDNMEDETQVDEVVNEDIVETEVVEESTEEVEVTEETPVDETVVEEVVEDQVPVVEDVTMTEGNSGEDFEAKFNELNTQHTALLEKYSTLETEVNELRSYKDNNEKSVRLQKEEELFSQFEEIDDNEEFVALKVDSANYSLEDLEIRCFALLGKIKHNKKNNKQAKKVEKTVVFNSITGNDYTTPVKGKYDDLISQYKDKK